GGVWAAGGGGGCGGGGAGGGGRGGCALQRRLARTVRSPESFRGGCSFGSPGPHQRVRGLSHSGSTAFRTRLVAAPDERRPRDRRRRRAAPDVDGHPGAVLDVGSEQRQRDAA